MSRNPTRPDLRSGWVLPALPVLLALALLEVSVRSSSPEGPAPAGREPSAREGLVGRSDQGGAVGLQGSERAEVRLPTHEELKRVRGTPRPTVDYLAHLRRAIERETPPRCGGWPSGATSRGRWGKSDARRW